MHMRMLASGVRSHSDRPRLPGTSASALNLLNGRAAAHVHGALRRELARTVLSENPLEARATRETSGARKDALRGGAQVRAKVETAQGSTPAADERSLIRYLDVATGSNGRHLPLAGELKTLGWSAGIGRSISSPANSGNSRCVTQLPRSSHGRHIDATRKISFAEKQLRNDPEHGSQRHRRSELGLSLQTAKSGQPDSIAGGLRRAIRLRALATTFPVAGIYDQRPGTVRAGIPRRSNSPWGAADGVRAEACAPEVLRMSA